MSELSYRSLMLLKLYAIYGPPADKKDLTAKSENLQMMHILTRPEAHGPQSSPECTAMKAIFSQNTINVACKKI